LGVVDRTQGQIDGVISIPLTEFADARGSVLHMLRCDASHFTKFGEIYFSETNPGIVKAWKRHKRMTQNFAVVSGSLRLVVYDGRHESASFGKVDVFDLGRENYQLGRVPNELWYGFKCVGCGPALMANCADIPHDPQEAEVIPPDSRRIPHRW
jgi:dTDP-4-dehydrorhamnose 3,5-epimerase